MEVINLQDKTKALEGSIQKNKYRIRNHLFKQTFFKIEVPLDLFDSGLDYEEKLVDTLIIFDFIKFDVFGSEKITEKDFNLEEVEVSVYLGWRYNPCVINKLVINKIDEDSYEIICELKVEFEYEMVAKNEIFSSKQS